MNPSLDLRILKALVSSKKFAVEFATECDVKLFSYEYWFFATHFCSYVKTFKEIPTQRVMLERLGKNANESQKDQINKVFDQLNQFSVNLQEYKHDLNCIKNRFASTQLNNLKEKLIFAESSNAEVSKTLFEISSVTQSIKSLNAVKSYERKTLVESISTFKEEYNARIKNPLFNAGIPTGYSYLDNVTDGLRPGELILIGAESGGGKSMLLMNMAIQMWMQKNHVDMRDNFSPGYNIMYFSLEMPYRPCLNRILSRISGCPSKKIRNSTLNKDESKNMKKALDFISAYPNQFEIIDIPRNATMENLEQMYEDAKANFTPDIVVIDYLGLMDYDGPDMDDWLKLGKVSEKIHEFARVHNVIVISAIQLNRAKGGKDVEDKIGLHRIGRSSLIMQNANIGIQIETRQNEKTYSDMIYHLIKNRDGEMGSGRIIKNLSCGTLIDDPTSNSDNGFNDEDAYDISYQADLLDI